MTVKSVKYEEIDFKRVFGNMLEPYFYNFVLVPGIPVFDARGRV